MTASGEWDFPWPPPSMDVLGGHLDCRATFANGPVCAWVEDTTRVDVVLLSGFRIGPLSLLASYQITSNQFDCFCISQTWSIADAEHTSFWFWRTSQDNCVFHSVCTTVKQFYCTGGIVAMNCCLTLDAPVPVLVALVLLSKVTTVEPSRVQSGIGFYQQFYLQVVPPDEKPILIMPDDELLCIFQFCGADLADACWPMHIIAAGAVCFTCYVQFLVFSNHSLGKSRDALTRHRSIKL